MRFPRNSRIFRGQLDIAPLASVFFLLLIFIMLTALVYTPGIPIKLASPPRQKQPGELSRTVTIDRQNKLFLERKPYGEGALFDKLREELGQKPGRAVLLVETHSPVSRDLVLRLRGLAQELHIAFEVSGAKIDLPAAERFTGTTHPTLSVAVNLGGQLFYENRVVQEDELKRIFSQAVRASQAPLTLLILADRSTELDILVRLATMAGEAGIAEVLQAVRPRLEARAPERRPVSTP